MGLYLLNLSVDTIEQVPSFSPQDLTVNDQESIVELVVEKILGYEDAIKETDDGDREEHNEKKNTKIDFLVWETSQRKADPYTSPSLKNRFLQPNSLLTAGFEAIDTPPPRF
ncbi:hypothetical protein GCM10011361_17820 [Muriicola marianensis]|uniref:Uncharacterized protein n=2 Tax=Muriicola marianensis TaxID=1324801 RepID=A0ABQ1R128_9FLAO|nr:hypothetical protein GCM10011361_17820 [Muriicola marianensis]